MVARRSTPPSPVLTTDQRRTLALKSAIMLRDCSLRNRFTDIERHACRLLMRKEASKWRRTAATSQQQSQLPSLPSEFRTEKDQKAWSRTAAN